MHVINYIIFQTHQSNNYHFIQLITKRYPVQMLYYFDYRDEYNDDQLPTHPCMQLVSNSEQVLSRLTARRLLTYMKTAEPTPDTTVDSNGGAHNFR